MPALSVFQVFDFFPNRIHRIDDRTVSSIFFLVISMLFHIRLIYGFYLDPLTGGFLQIVESTGTYSAAEGGTTQDWLRWLARADVRQELEDNRGSWINYVKGAAYRFRDVLDFKLCGMDVMVSGTIPVAAGLSSSSSLVVATAEALSALNCLNMTDRQFVDLCGEGEWFVGSRGGAGDHAAMRCSRAGRITHLNFKPFSIGQSVPFPADCAVIVADSLEQSKKSEGSRDKFNARVAAYEFALMLIKRLFPDKTLVEFRDLATCGTHEQVMAMLSAMPPKITRRALLAMLPESHDRRLPNVSFL